MSKSYRLLVLVVLTASLQVHAQQLTARQVIERIEKATGAQIPDKTVDTIKGGDPDEKVTGIATTFLDTYAVLQKAAADGHNLVITHEPTFYTHTDDKSILGDDPVQAQKEAFIRDHHLVVWRFHDLWHLREPDGILEGVTAKLGWGKFQDATVSNLFHLPPTTLRELEASLKQKLGAQSFRVVGDPAMQVTRDMTSWILWSMFAGVELGVDTPQLALQVHVFSDIFLRLIKTIVAPLILGTLISGIAAHGSLKEVGRLGIKSLIYFEVLTTIALLVGLAAINISRAGVGLGVASSQIASAATVLPVAPASAPKWDQFLLHVFPENLARSIAENEVLQVVVFAVLFGLALTRLPEETRRPLLTVIHSFTKVMFQFTNLVMYLSPLAVGTALAYTIAHSGSGAILGLAKLVATLYCALAAFLILGMLPAAMLARVPIRRFLEAVAEPAFIAFSTSTSEAALPVAMENMEALGVPENIVAFVIPTGYSFNLGGTAIYLALASVFIAQAGGLHLGWQTQLIMLATLVLTSKGVAGVPRASLVILMATAASFHLPLEPIVLILGVDALMDMGRTAINVTGNCLASVVVARWEGKFLLAPKA